MSDDVLEQILIQIKRSPFYSIQLDESTDIAGLSQLSVFVRYINNAADRNADHEALLLHTEGRRLSRGRVMKRVCDTQETIAVFPRQQNFVAFAETFSQIAFNAKVASLADACDSLDCLNLSMQCAGFTVIDHAARVAAYYKKLILWKRHVTRDEYDMFHELTNYICDKGVDIRQTMIKHLEQLAQQFAEYYGENLACINENNWIIDRFAGTDLAHRSLHVAKEFMVMTAEATNRITFASFKAKYPKDSSL